jgi:hypothetical protein
VKEDDAMDSSRFYLDLPSFSEFREVVSDRHFRPLPADWMVVVADIQGSTKAIEEGRYKDVNTLGAAAIVAAQNAMRKVDFPFVFGGDGATLLVPPHAFEAVAAGLDGLRAMARARFGMTLRVGAIKASELFATGCSVEVGKVELFAGKSMASFRGGGLSKADALVKGDSARYSLPERPENRADLTGLSCRWKPIPSEKGLILTLLVSPKGPEPDAVLRKVLAELDVILNGDAVSANPVHTSNMSYRSVRDNLAAEARLHESLLSPAFLARAAEIVAAVLIFRWRLPALVFDAGKYADSMGAHSDFRKFDDVLRMVVDCTTEQCAAVRALLERLAAEGSVSYGLHEAAEALMTCFVYDVKDGGHIHFIDGGDGGYAMAARQFKAQLKGS